jgi:hypothetical protein
MSLPRICAEFQLDEKGRPIATTRNNLKHYKIRLFMESVPQDTYAVTYKLHESYYNPTREVRRGNPKFEELITSYGDYIVKAEVRGKKSFDLEAVELSQALKESYGPNLAGPIREAIDEIKEK